MQLVSKYRGGQQVKAHWPDMQSWHKHAQAALGLESCAVQPVV